MSEQELDSVRSKPPPEIVDTSGRVNFGVFNAPFSRVNLEDARVRSLGVRLPRRLSRLRLKEWQHFGVITPELFLSFAIVDAKFMSKSWCHVVEREGGDHFEHTRQSPILRVGIARELFRDETFAHAPAYHVEVDNLLEEGAHRIRIQVAKIGRRPAIHATLECHHDLSAIQPLVVVLPVGRGRGMYSHKVPLAVEGTVSVGGSVFDVSAETSLALLDIHKAHYPRHTFWNWATCAGRDAQGRVLALNLTRNVNEDDVRYNENALWIDGRLTHLGPARFDVDKQRLMDPWRITTTDGAVDLTFLPQGERCEDIRLGVVRSSFHQPYGTFHGTVRIGDEEVVIEELFGVCEDHRATW